MIGEREVEGRGISSDEVLRSFREGVRGYIRSRVEGDEAQEIEQEVYLKVHRSLQGGFEPNSVSGWVYSIARNAVIDHYRRAGSAPGFDALESVELAGDDEPDLPGEESARQQLAACMRPMVAELPDNYREALEMTVFEGLGQAEAAERAEVSLSGMKSRVQRGRGMLLSKLQRCCELELDGRGGPVECSGPGC